MQIERMSAANALQCLSQVERTAQCEMPSFVAAPRPLGTRIVDGAARVVFECRDSANDATYVVEVPFGSRPLTQAQANERIAKCHVSALEVADRIAKAVFN